ncbi:MAG: hypothetical protein GX541_02845, partial [Clostridiales bacterium]|nr:hypothetical protein [Clostridiales bacterium]
MNKTKVGKASRMLSALIVFTMLLALIPASQITASADDPQQIVVDFSQTTTTHDGTKYIITSSPGYTVVDELSTV